MRGVRRGAALLLTLIGLVRPVAGQSDALAEARRLGEAGRFAEAADSARAWLSTHPDDPGVRWLLARFLHWSGRPDAARPEYEAAVRGLPGDPWLRLDQVRALLDARRFDAAEAVLDVVLGMERADAEALAQARSLRATAAYWRGDLPTAIERYEEALASDPSDAESRARLGEIRDAGRPWVRLRTELWRDNQPYRRGSAALELGTWLDPLWALSFQGAPGRLTAGDGATAWDASARLGGYIPGARLELGGAVGLTGGSVASGTRTTWTGEARLAVRIGPHARLGVRAWRERYVWTAASADTLLPVRGVEAALNAADGPGWAGEVVVRREVLPDANAVRTAYGWVLAPLASWLRAGYAVSFQDSDESSWVPSDTLPMPGGPGQGQGPGGPPSAGVVTTGSYVPYFTPEETHVHALLGEVTVPLGSARARGDVSWGVDAVEQVPYWVSSGVPGLGSASLDFSERSFHPWTVRGALELPAGPDGNVRLEVERGRTAFYRSTRVSLGWTRRLGARAASDP